MTVTTPYDGLERSESDPFGLLVQAPVGSHLNDVPPALLAPWVGESKVVVLRGFGSLAKDDFAEWARRWGPLLRWEFGEVLDLVVQEQPSNYLFTSSDVPYHWDGAFAERAPSYFFFQCLQAPLAGAGGETRFVDSTRLYRDAPAERRELWDRVTITYSTAKAGHLGGRFEADLVSPHPLTGRPTLRYAEPLGAEQYGNSLHLEINGIPEEQHEELLKDLHERLYRPASVYTHTWREGDFVLVDNHAVLHARAAFRQDSPRRLQRVQVM